MDSQAFGKEKGSPARENRYPQRHELWAMSHQNEKFNLARFVEGSCGYQGKLGPLRMLISLWTQETCWLETRNFLFDIQEEVTINNFCQ